MLSTSLESNERRRHGTDHVEHWIVVAQQRHLDRVVYL